MVIKSSTVEIWNEVNAGTFIKGPATQDKAYYYAELLKTVYPAIKAARPDVRVVGRRDCAYRSWVFPRSCSAMVRVHS